MKAKTHFDAKGQALFHAGANQRGVLAATRELPGWARSATVHGYLGAYFGAMDLQRNGPGWRKRMRERGVTRVQVVADGALVPAGLVGGGA